MWRLFVALGLHGSRLEAATVHSFLVRGILAACSKPRIQRRIKASLRVVARAESYIEAMAQEALTLEEIAIANNVSARVLQSSFRVHRNTTPMRYLRDVRLDRAYRDLRTSGNRLVTEVALNSGFTHFGRFSSEYKARFVELPSTTRSRGCRTG